MPKLKPLKPVILAGAFKLKYSFVSLAVDVLKPKNRLNGITCGTLKPKERLLGTAISTRDSLNNFVGILISVPATVVRLIGSVFDTFTAAHYVKRSTLLLAIILTTASATAALTTLFITPEKTAAAVNNTINFQARLENATGSIVADGSYNVEFKLYDAPSGGALLWTEDHYNNAATGIRVANGYLSTSLGSITAFSGINWNQQLWLTMNIGGTGTGAVTLDGEMSPRLALTAVPFALQAAELGNGTNKATLDASGNLQLQQASTISTTTGALAVQGATTLTLQTAAGTSSSAVTIQSGNASAGASGNISLDNGTFTSGTPTISLGTTNARAVAIGNTTGATGVTIQAGSGGIALGAATTVSNNLTVTSAGNAAFQRGSDYSATGITNDVNLGNSSLVRLIGASAQTITGITGGADGRILTLMNPAGQAATLANQNTSSTTAGDRIITGTGGDITIPTDGSVTLIYDGSTSRWRVIGTSTATGGYIQLQGSTPGTAQTGNFNISGTGIAGTLQASIFDTASGVALNIGNTNATSINLGKTTSNILTTINGRALVKPTSGNDSTTAFQVQNAAGSNLFTADSTNTALVLGNDGTPAALTVRGGAQTGNNAAGSNISFDASNGTGNGGSGAFVFRTAASGTNAVSFDTSVQKDDGGGALVNTLTQAINIGANSNRLLIVNITIIQSQSLSTPDGVTYNGTNLTKLDTQTCPSADSPGGVGVFCKQEVWYMVAPATGSHNIVIKLAAAATGRITMEAGSYFNVDQTTPLGTQVKATGSTTGTQNTSNSITATTSQMVFDALAADNIPLSSSTAGANVRQTEITGVFQGGIQDKSGTGASQTFTWSINSGDWADMLIPVNPVSNTTPDSLTERLRIAPSGNIGINNSNPQFTLDVTGNANFTTAAFAPLFDTAAAGTLSIGTTNATTVNIANSAVAHTIAIGTGAAVQGITIGSSNSTSTLVLQGGTGAASAISLLTGNNGATAGGIQIGNSTGAFTQAITIGTNSTASSTTNTTIGSTVAGSVVLQGSGITQTVSGGNETIKTSTNSTAGFTIQNSSVANIFNVDTLTTLNLMTNGDFESGDTTTGWVAKASGAAISQVTTQAWQGNGSLQITSGTSAGNAGAQFNVTLSANATYTLSMYLKSTNGPWSDVVIGRQDVSGTNVNCPTVVVNTVWTRFTCTFTTGGTITTPNIYVMRISGSNNETLFVDGVQLQTGGVASGFNAGGGVQLNGIVNSPLTVQNNVDSATALQVQSAAGYNILSVATSITDGWVINGNSLNTATERAASVITNGYAYVIGGINAGTSTATTTVQFAPVNSNGSLGTWTTTTALPQALYSMSQTAATYNGYIYVVGGYTTGAVAQTTVYYAKINTDGTLGNWLTATSLGSALAEGEALVANGYLYYLGGTNGTTAVNTSQFAKINSDGTIGSWTSTGLTFPQNMTDFQASVSNGYIYTVGGAPATNNIFTAKLTTAGTLTGTAGNWFTPSTVAANRLPSSLTDVSNIVANGYLYTIGGSGPTSAVDYFPLNADPSATLNNLLVAGSLPSARWRGSASYYNGYIYYFGGDSAATTTVSTVYYSSTQRISVNADLDLLGTAGGPLGVVSNSGGSVFASNLFAANRLTVQGNALLQGGLSVNGELNANGNLTFGEAATRTLNVQARTTNTTGSNLTISAGAAGTGASAFAGGVLTLQGGNAAGTGNANGGNIQIQGGAGTGTGVSGLVVITTPTFQTAGSQSCAVNCTITQANVDSNGAVIVNATAAGLTVTLNDPTITTAGRIVYVTAANGSNDFTLSVNGGGTGNTIAMRQNTTATMIWNGVDWTAAGASSSTTLQSAYDNTLTSAGGAELVLSKTSNHDGLTIRDSSSSPVNGTLLEVQTQNASTLFSVNGTVTDYANNGGAETAGVSSSTFPAGTWTTFGSGVTLSRNTTTTNVATGQASVSVTTSATATTGTKNTLASTLTANLNYNVSFSALLASGTFTTMNVYYSIDGTAASVACVTGQAIATSVWTKVNCVFTAPASGITSNNAILIYQTDATARTFYIDNLSVTISASQNYATDGSVDDSVNFTTNWTQVGGSTVSRSTTVGNDTSDSAQVITTGANQGVRNKLSINPLTSTLYRITAYSASTTTGFNTFTVRYSRDGGTSFVNCADYNTQTISSSTTSFTQVTCYITTDSTTATTPYVYFTQTDATGRTWYVDTFSMTISSNAVPNVQVGGGIYGGPVTLFTLDRSASAPIAANNTQLLGSMYYDTTLGKLQCYESDGWGACGSSPDNIITISPEYTNAVLHGIGVGTMTSDICSDFLNINDGSSGQPSICGTNETHNFYKWTSPQASAQTYSIYVTYQLPSTFKAFNSGQTSLLGRTDSASSTVQYTIYRNSTASGLTACGSTVSVSTGVQTTWQTGTATGAADPSTCSFGPGDSIVFKIDVIASSNANAYVGDLDFSFSNK